MNSKEGRRKARETLLAKDPDHYKKLGAIGGAKSKGRIVSKETRRKISEARKRRNRENSTLPA